MPDSLCSHTVPALYLLFGMVVFFSTASFSGESMRPTLNPDNTSFQDRILIRDFTDSEDLKKSSGSIVFALKNDRRLVKRLAVVEDYESDISGIKCWLESDAQKDGYYDSKIFGYVNGSDVKGNRVQ